MPSASPPSPAETHPSKPTLAIPRASFTPPPPRLFLGLELPAATRAHLSSLQPTSLPCARLHPPTSLHLTLHFLGRTPLPALYSALIAAGPSLSLPPFTLHLRSVGVFPPTGRPAVVWAGVAASPALAALHDALGQALSRAGYRVEERAFCPHVTLARVRCRREGDVKAVGEFVQGLEGVDGGVFRVRQFAIFESCGAGRAGPVYVPRKRFWLAGEGRAETGEEAGEGGGRGCGLAVGNEDRGLF